MIYVNKFWNNKINLLYSTSLPFNVTSKIVVGGGYPCATISNVKISLQYFNSNYVTGFMSDISGN